ncbi:MAG: hypothetical protein EBZ69_00580 [Alphaproteobacteria bacterium]|nr:hypothetical protein [Alphaproteobacteria bacterium]
MSCPEHLISQLGRQGVGVIQPQSGLDYPLVAPSEDIRYLIADFHLSLENDVSSLAPFYISNLYGVGCIENEPAEEFITPVHDADILVRGANGDVVFDSACVDTKFETKEWGDDYRFYSWKNEKGVCNLLAYTSWADTDSSQRFYDKYLTPQNGALDARSVYVLPRRLLSISVGTGAGSFRMTGKINLVNGYNTTLTAAAPTIDNFAVNTAVTIGAAAGSGKGKYSTCGDNPAPIVFPVTKINGIAAPTGDFLLSATDCLYVRRPTRKVGDDVVPDDYFEDGNAKPISAEYLVVGGGGGAGGSAGWGCTTGGGGGGGQALEGTITITPNTEISINVDEDGNVAPGGVGGQDATESAPATKGSDGGKSKLAGIEAGGGGGGGAGLAIGYWDSPTGLGAGRAGTGGGGGGGAGTTVSPTNVTQGGSGLGPKGGDGKYYGISNGGGGCLGPGGEDGAGVGGAGLESSITGETRIYGQGGNAMNVYQDPTLFDVPGTGGNASGDNKNGGGGAVIIAYPVTHGPLKIEDLTYTVSTTSRPGYRVYKFTGGKGKISPGTLRSPLEVGAVCDACCKCDDYVELARKINQYRNQYAYIGARVNEVKNIHEQNIQKWIDERACGLDNPLRVLLVAQRCPYMDVVLLVCNPCSDCLYAKELRIELEPPAGVESHAEVVRGYTALFSATSNGRPVVITREILGQKTILTVPFAPVKNGDSAYVRFRVKFSAKSEYAVTGTLTGTLIDNTPILTGCVAPDNQTERLIAQATATQALYCDNNGETTMP